MTDALAIDPPTAAATLEAIVGVYRSRGAAFLRVAAAITGDAAAAHDSVQEGFALAIRHRSRYRGDGPLEAWIWRLVAKLPERQRLAVFLRYYADLDYAAIGTALGIRTGTVSATLEAGIRSLRRMAEEVEL